MGDAILTVSLAIIVVGLTYITILKFLTFIEPHLRGSYEGILTDEEANEWLDDSQRQFLSWEEDQGEPTLSPKEHKKLSET